MKAEIIFSSCIAGQVIFLRFMANYEVFVESKRSCDITEQNNISGKISCSMFFFRMRTDGNIVFIANHIFIVIYGMFAVNKHFSAVHIRRQGFGHVLLLLMCIATWTVFMLEYYWGDILTNLWQITLIIVVSKYFLQYYAAK